MSAGWSQPLPVRVRPAAEEGAESYVRRLARANHLKPSYLRRHLATPQGSYGPIQPEQLAAATGRTLPALLRAFPDLAARPRQRGTRRKVDDEKRHNQARKRTLFAAIRRDSASGLSRRAIERKHHVGRRTIVQALASAAPPERKKPKRAPGAIDELQPDIDQLLETNPTIPVKTVWERLVDDHDATVSYGAVRAYIARRRTVQLPTNAAR